MDDDYGKYLMAPSCSNCGKEGHSATHSFYWAEGKLAAGDVVDAVHQPDDKPASRIMVCFPYMYGEGWLETYFVGVPTILEV